MPTLTLTTNLEVDGVVASNVLKEVSLAVSRITGKPESNMMVLLNGAVPLFFGGSEEAAAYGELVSVGGIGDEVNKELSAAISEILANKMSIPPSRFYIKFDNKKVQSEAAVCLHALHQ